MKIEIKVPAFPESVTEATLLKWHKNIGDFVKQEENLVDLETDKVVLEVPAPEDGVLTEIIAKTGDTVKSGKVIAYIDTSAKNLEKTSAGKEVKTVTVLDKEEDSKSYTKELDKKVDNLAKETTEEIKVMPSAKKLITEHDIQINNISGSGKGGRILKDDVLRTLSEGGSRLEERVPMSRLRKRVAERLLESQRTNAILTTFNEVNMKPIQDIRTNYKDMFEKKYGVKLGFMSFFIKAVVLALKEYPVVNASIDSDNIVYHGYFDIGIAVSSPRGLVVPIIKNAENYNLAELELKILDFASRAKTGKIDIEELTGGTFSITNGGVFGSMMSTPIINPPQSAILGMHSIKERVIVEKNQMVIRPMMYIALSYDHRLIDGKDAVQALVAIKNALEDPIRFILEV